MAQEISRIYVNTTILYSIEDVKEQLEWNYGQIMVLAWKRRKYCEFSDQFFFQLLPKYLHVRARVCSNFEVNCHLAN